MHYGGTVTLVPTIVLYLTILFLVYRIIYSFVLSRKIKDVIFRKRILNLATGMTILIYFLLKSIFSPIQEYLHSERMGYEDFNSISQWTQEERLSNPERNTFYLNYKKQNHIIIDLAYFFGKDSVDKIVRTHIILFLVAIFICGGGTYLSLIIFKKI